MIAATLTTGGLMAVVLLGVAMLCAPVIVHHMAIDLRERRTRRRDLELIRSRRAAHEARKRSREAADEDYAASVRAERDEARRVAVQLLRRGDALQDRVARLESELAGARDYVHRLNRSNLARLATVIEADKTLRLPVVVVPRSDTREVPALPGPPPHPTTHHHHRRRSVLAPA